MKYYSIIIGSNGIILNISKNYKITNSIFIKNFTEEIEEVKKFFLKNKKSPIYIFLDNIGQNYNIKKFPILMPWDLQKIVNRKFNFEIPSTDLRTKIFLGKNKEAKVYEYIFISSSIDETIKEVLEFIKTLPNIINGIFFLPLESQNILKSIFKNLNLIKKAEPKWTLLLIENKVSGIRQIAFRGTKLIFTRFIYDDNEMEHQDFKSKSLFFENDIIKTIGFVKRFSVDFKSSDLTIISITSNEIKNILSKLKLTNIKCHTFTPLEINSFLNKKFKPNEDDIFCDNIFEKYIMNNKNIFKFFLTEMKILKNLLSLFLISKYLFLIVFCIFIFFISKFIIVFTTFTNDINHIETELDKTNKELEFLKINDPIVLEKEPEFIIENAKIYQFYNRNSKNPFIIFPEVMKYFHNNNNVKIKEFKWELENYFHKNVFSNTIFKYKYTLFFNINNEENTLDSLLIKYSDIQKQINIDFTNYIVGLPDIDKRKLREQYSNYKAQLVLLEK